MTIFSESTELQLFDYRRRTAELYAAVRGAASPAEGHALWRHERDRLFREHPQSPLAQGHALRESGLPYWPYDERLRFELDLVATASPTTLDISTGGDETTTLRRVGTIDLPDPVGATVDVWWLAQYGGGLFIPVRDGTAGIGSYGGGRYLLDSVKGADLGLSDGRLIVDLNFLYHPSCRYDDAWQCPLAPPGNQFAHPVEAGERL